jgi:cyclopropane-fatty-acyl-phospholipid synthase
MPLILGARDAASNALRRLYALLLLPILTPFLSALARIVETLTYRDLLPDCCLRFIIRSLLRVRLASMPQTLAARQRAKLAFVEALRSMPVAVQQQEANEQHYELPTEYFSMALGKHLKYSCCLYGADTAATAAAAALDADRGPIAASAAQRQLRRMPPARAAEELARAEASMLALTCARADLRDGQRVLELGCGWGSLSLWMAAAFPKSEIVAVSNSRTQRRHIQKQARDRGLTNLTVITADMAEFVPPGCGVGGGGGAGGEGGGKEGEAEGEGAAAATTTTKDDARLYDRIVSCEMLEHMKNYELLFARVASWLNPRGGKFFVHVFAHRDFPYHFEAKDETDWMARHFFSGGTMPSLDLFLYFQGASGGGATQGGGGQGGGGSSDRNNAKNPDGAYLRIADVWWVNGGHYSRTLEAWLARHDQQRREVLRLFAGTYGPGQAALRWFVMWRIFYLACSELFAYSGGDEWGVAHYLFERCGGEAEAGAPAAGRSAAAGAGAGAAAGRLAAGLRARFGTSAAAAPAASK